jgi:hypothetical protein
VPSKTSFGNQKEVYSMTNDNSTSDSQEPEDPPAKPGSGESELTPKGRSIDEILSSLADADGVPGNVKNLLAGLSGTAKPGPPDFEVEMGPDQPISEPDIDISLDPSRTEPGAGLEARKPERSLFALLTPGGYRRNPSSRLYGWLMREYRKNPASLERDFPHRTGVDWSDLSKRIGWFTFDDIERIRPGSCPWPL